MAGKAVKVGVFLKVALQALVHTGQLVLGALAMHFFPMALAAIRAVLDYLRVAHDQVLGFNHTAPYAVMARQARFSRDSRRSIRVADDRAAKHGQYPQAPRSLSSEPLFLMTAVAIDAFVRRGGPTLVGHSVADTARPGKRGRDIEKICEYQR